MLPLMLGLGLLLLIATDKGPAKTAADEIFVWLRGQLRYRPKPRKEIIDNLVYRQIELTPQPGLAFIRTPPVTGQVFQTLDGGAWGWTKGMHDQGFDLWVRPVLHLPFGGREPILFILPGGEVPQGHAMLIGADTPWPSAPAGVQMLP